MKTNAVTFLKGKRLYLRPLEAEDLDRCRLWINDPDLRRYILRQFPMDALNELRWHETRDRTSAPQDISLAIVLKKGDRHIGNMGLHRIDWINRNATTGAIIGEADCREKGYGAEAKELLLAYAFDTLGLHRISSNVLSTNPRSLAYLKKSGYREEGVLREHIFRDGRWIDDIQLGLLADEWHARRKSITR